MQRIIIYENEALNCWMADFGADSEVYELFGTTQLPTGYRLTKPRHEVCLEIEKLNPGYTVVATCR